MAAFTLPLINGVTSTIPLVNTIPLGNSLAVTSAVKMAMNPTVELVSIGPSSQSKKKMMAKFLINGRSKTTHFGAKGYSDFTIHKDEARKERYLARHRKRENWDDPTTAGALSRWILWNKPTLEESIDDYKTRFGFE